MELHRNLNDVCCWLGKSFVGQIHISEVMRRLSKGACWQIYTPWWCLSVTRGTAFHWRKGHLVKMLVATVRTEGALVWHVLQAFYGADEGHKGWLDQEDFKVATIMLLGFKPSKVMNQIFAPVRSPQQFSVITARCSSLVTSGCFQCYNLVFQVEVEEIFSKFVGSEDTRIGIQRKRSTQGLTEQDCLSVSSSRLICVDFFRHECRWFCACDGDQNAKFWRRRTNTTDFSRLWFSVWVQLWSFWNAALHLLNF